MSVVSGGDWICSDVDCKNLNFAKRTHCNRCNKPNPNRNDSSKGKKRSAEIGKQAAEASRGLFSADDWSCSKCGNVNWARRQTCNMCNQPKHCDIEERTGYGGGYNDRGVVEYKEREESDDEYDEFGRKKKKSKPNSFKADEILKKTEAINHEPQEEGSDEEDEEDDGDISKYKLFDDDEDEQNIDPKTASKEDSNKYERSSSSDSSSSSSSSSSDSSHSSSYRRRRSDSRSRSSKRHTKSRSGSKDSRRSRSRSKDYRRRNRSRSHDRGRYSKRR